MKKVILTLVVAFACAYSSTAQILKVDQQAAGVKNYAKVTQTGGNVLDLIQAGDMGTIITAQTSVAMNNNNNITVAQIGSFNGTITSQEGTTNQITLSQDNRTGINTLPSVNGNGAKLTQKGMNNALVIDQISANATADNKAGNLVIVEQDGATNRISLDQTSDGVGHVATIKQLLNATNSYVALGQTGALNTATLTQVSGEFNTIEVAQANNATVTLVGNTVTMTQDGNKNEARLAQIGDTNKLTLTQTGMENKLQLDATAASIATQNGSGNTAILTQTGDLHQIRFNQSGTANVATVTQAAM